MPSLRLPSILAFSLLQLVLMVDCQSMRFAKSAVYPCSSELFLFRRVLSVSMETSSLAQCLAKCNRLQECKASVLQTYAAGPARCTMLSSVLRNLTMSEMPVSQDTSLTCRALLVDQACLNGGTMQYGTCACTNDFIGEQCETPRPSSWPLRNWTLVLTAYQTTSPSHTIHNSVIHDSLHYHEPKIRSRNKDNTATSVLSHIWTSVSSTPLCAGVVANVGLDKIGWNRIAPGSKRTIRYFYCDGRNHKIIMDGTTTVMDVKSRRAFEILASNENLYPGEIASNASNAELKDVLAKGYSIFRSTFARDEEPEVVLQDTMKHLSLVSGEINIPANWVCSKYALGKDKWALFQRLSKGMCNGVATYSPETLAYDPMWFSVKASSADEAFIKARGYILQGQQMRVKVGSDYHDAIDVIRTGTLVWFVLSPYMNATDAVPFQMDDDLVVKSIVSLDGTRRKCVHVLEGDSIFSYSLEFGLAVDFFVDARHYTNVFSVYSNSSVAHGRLEELRDLIISGSDIRVLIQYENVDKDRIMNTQRHTVLDTGKVSSETIPSWHLNDAHYPDLRLAQECDFEYVLVTSDGYMEVANFNVWSTVNVREETDVLITWLVG